MGENSVYLSKKDPQEKKGPEAEERTEPYSCTVHNSVSFVRFPFRPLAPMNGSSLSSSFPIDCLRADPHTDIESV
jgi:hypothetical protein